MKEGWTIKTALESATSYFEEKKVESPRLNAELLMACVLRKRRVDLYLEFDQLLRPGTLAFLKKLVLKRSNGIPLSYLTGEQYFMDLKFKVSPGVYIPRPETELLVEETIRTIQGSRFKVQGRNEPLKPFIILDLGTGCGNIAISLVKRIKGSKAYAIDICEEALKVATENARFHNVEARITFLRGDMFAPLDGLNLSGRIDLIISNPPYIAIRDMENLPDEVKNEPRIALEGGENGLGFYERIVHKAPEFLKNKGLLSLEIGYNQAEGVKKMIDDRRELEPPLVVKDYDGNQRIILTRRR